MTKIQQGLRAIACGRMTREKFQRQFSDMLLMGLLSKNYAIKGEHLSLTDAGRRAMADRA